jgi:transcriptional regulator with XRE-family HTH domain
MTPNGLRDLIRRTRIANGPELTLAEIARRAGVTRQTALNWAHREPSRLEPDQLRAIAAGLQLPLIEVVRAALTSLGLPSDAGFSVEDAVRADPDVTVRDKRTLLALMDTYREEGKARSLPGRPPQGGAVAAHERKRRETEGDQKPGATR